MRGRMSWAAMCRYPGLTPFIFGNVTARDRAEALSLLGDLWAATSPHPAPDMEPMPGALVFMPGEHGEEA